MRKRILLAGESWTTNAVHIKGFDQFGSVTHHNGATAFLAALRHLPFDIVHMPSHVAQTEFPATRSCSAISAPIRCCCIRMCGWSRRPFPTG
jgi:uncharacterized membrane protein